MNQKSKSTSDKRGYVQLDFLFACLIFFVFIFSVYTLIDSRIDELDARYNSLQLKGYAKDICLLMTTTPGYPANWEENPLNIVSYVGLYNSTLGHLESEKLSGLTFNVFTQIINNVDMNAYFNVRIMGTSTGNQYAVFGLLNPQDAISESYSCFANYNDEIVRVFVEVWR